MTVITTNTSPYLSTDAQFRAYCQSISNTIVAGGWVMTADTGQANFATMISASVAYTAAGYNIFKMNDALQATAPCYIKLEYGCGSTTSTPGFWITVGTGSDGAGNLTGAGTRCPTYPITNSAIAYPTRYSIDTNRLVIALWTGWTTMFICVERMHDSNGADTALGMIYATANGSGPGYSCAVYIGGPITSYMTGWNVTLPTQIGSLAFGSTVYLLPVRTVGLGETSPFLGMCMYYSPDLVIYNPISTKMWDGVTRLVLPMAVPTTAVSYGTSGAIAMRYD